MNKDMEWGLMIMEDPEERDIFAKKGGMVEQVWAKRMVKSGPFGIRLFIVRLLRQKSRKETAEILGWPHDTYALYEIGRYIPTTKRAAEAAEKLHVPYSWLIGEDPVFPWWDSTDLPAEQLDPADADKPYFMKSTEEDPIKILHQVEQLDYEMETLMREQKLMQRLASYIEQPVASTEAEKRRIKETIDKLAAEYSGICSRINYILDLRQQANSIIDMLDDSFKRDIMRRHYFQGQMWTAMAEENGYSKEMMTFVVDEIKKELRIKAAARGAQR